MGEAAAAPVRASWRPRRRRTIAVYRRANRWWIEYEHEGKRYRESAGRTKRVALQALAIRRAQIAQGKSRTEAPRRSRRLEGSAPE